MESFFYVSLVALAISTLALLVAIWVGKRMTDNETVTIPKDREISGTQDFRISQVLSDIDYLAKCLRIQKGIIDYGSRVMEAYDDFITRVEDEFAMLEGRQVVGREYVFRSSMLLFSLMMARVYLQVVGPRDSIPKIEAYIERAKKLT